MNRCWQLLLPSLLLLLFAVLGTAADRGVPPPRHAASPTQLSFFRTCLRVSHGLRDKLFVCRRLMPMIGKPPRATTSDFEPFIRYVLNEKRMYHAVVFDTAFAVSSLTYMTPLDKSRIVMAPIAFGRFAQEVCTAVWQGMGRKAAATSPHIITADGELICSRVALAFTLLGASMPQYASQRIELLRSDWKSGLGIEIMFVIKSCRSSKYHAVCIADGRDLEMDGSASHALAIDARATCDAAKGTGSTAGDSCARVAEVALIVPLTGGPQQRLPDAESALPADYHDVYAPYWKSLSQACLWLRPLGACDVMKDATDE